MGAPLIPGGRSDLSPPPGAQQAHATWCLNKLSPVLRRVTEISNDHFTKGTKKRLEYNRVPLSSQMKPHGEGKRCVLQSTGCWALQGECSRVK